MVLAVTIILMFMNFMNILLHGVGVYLLIYLYTRGKLSVQNILILNLSFTELIMNSLEVIRAILSILIEYNVSPSVCNEFKKYLLITMFSGISIVFYIGMFYITLDRLTCITLSLHYKIYCTLTRAKFVLLVTWICAVLICFLFNLAYYLCDFDWEGLLYKFVFPILEFAFILLALITYILIFRKYSHSESALFRQRGITGFNVKPKSKVVLFQESRFFVAVVLIFTFILFMVIPDLVLLFVGVIDGKMSEELMTACWISYAISNMADACIYIFIQERMKKLLMLKLKRMFQQRVHPQTGFTLRNALATIHP